MRKILVLILAGLSSLLGQTPLPSPSGGGGGGGGTGTVTSITLVGTANQITVTGTCTVTTTGTCTFSIPSDFRLPGTINKLTLTQPATGATVTIADGKTLTVSKTLTLTGTDNVTITFPASDAAVATLGLTNTFTGRQDASGAASTAPAKTGTSLPVTCGVGDLYFKSDVTAGQNIYECQSINTWTQQSGAASPGGSNTQCQYNNSGAFGGITGCTTNGTVVTLTNPIVGTQAQNDNSTKAASTAYVDGKARAFSCSNPGLGDGLNAAVAGTYLQTNCYNGTGSTVTLTGFKAYSDNNGTSTCNVTNGAGTALLTGAITATTSYAAGTQSATVTLANADFLKFTFVADGTTKQLSCIATGTY